MGRQFVKGHQNENLLADELGRPGQDVEDTAVEAAVNVVQRREPRSRPAVAPDDEELVLAVRRFLAGVISWTIKSRKR